MSVDRRHFLLAGSTLAGGGFASAAHAAASAAQTRNVTDFGVDPRGQADQTQPLQTAIDALSREGEAVLLPAGVYRAGKLALPARCSLLGVPGHTFLVVDEVGGAVVEGGMVTLFGIGFSVRAAKTGPAQLTFSRSAIRIDHCAFLGAGKTAMKLDACSGSVEAVSVSGYADSGIDAAAASILTINACRFVNCGTGIRVSSGESTIIAQNHFDRCGTGIAANGIGTVSGNIVRGAKDFGLKLGLASGDGRIVAQGNLLDDCGVGIGVTASGDDVFASLNFIHGARNGSIRAFDGDKLVGRDLARESAEVYLNLTVAGNVAR